MVVVILLLILAVLLFGASSVLGALGSFLGTAAVLIALSIIVATASVTPTHLVLLIGGIVGIGVAALYLVNWFMEPHIIAKLRAEQRNERIAELPRNLSEFEREREIDRIDTLFPLPEKRGLKTLVGMALKPFNL